MDPNTQPGSDTGTPPATPPPSSAPASDAGAWADAAKDVPTTATPSTGDTSKIADQPMPTYTQPPVVITPHQPKGIMGVVQSVADALTGTTRPEIATGSDGRKYVKETTLTHGEQWRQIAGELVSGAAAGLAAGKGAGNMGKAAFAGVQEGEHLQDRQQQQRKDMSVEARQQNLDDANNQMQKQQLAASAWKARRNQIEGSQKDIEFQQQLEDRYIKQGGELLGTVETPAAISKILKVNPDVMKDLVQNHTIELTNHYNEDGKIDGIKVFKMPAGHGAEILPAGSIFHTFDPLHPDTLQEHHASDPMTAREQNNYDAAAVTAQNKFLADKKEQDLKQAQIEKDEEDTKRSKAETPSTVAKNNAEANKANAEARKTSIDTVGDGADPSLTHKTIVNGMLDGSVDITKAVGIFRDPHAREQYIAEAKQQDPGWTMQKYQDMMNMRTDLTKGKLGDQVQSFNTFLGHAGTVANDVNKLRNTNAPILNHSINWLRTNATGNPIVAGMLPEIDATRGEFQTFISNHALQKSEIARGEKLLSEDQSPAQMQAAIKDFMQVALTRLGSIQTRVARTFGDKTPQLIDAQNVQHIRDLGLDRYAANYGLMPHAAAPAGGGVQPGEPTARDTQGRTLVVRNGQWVPAQQ